MKKNLPLGFLRIIALVFVLVGAAGSLHFVLEAGSSNNSVLLVFLFVSWVLAPFIALLFANVIFRRWAVITRTTLYGLTIVLTIGSLIIYSGALSLPGALPAEKFLMVPLVSWLLLAIVLPLAASLSRRSNSI